MNWKVVAVIGLCVGAIVACGASQQDTAASPGATSSDILPRGAAGSPNAAPTTTGSADGIAVPERRNR